MEYSPSFFWDLSLYEVYDLMESYKRRQKIKGDEYMANLKAKISLNSTLARQIGEYTACLFSKDAQITPLDKLFPSLFDPEDAEEEKVNNDMTLYKARMEEFMIRHNSKIDRKEE